MRRKRRFRRRPGISGSRHIAASTNSSRSSCRWLRGVLTLKFLAFDGIFSFFSFNLWSSSTIASRLQAIIATSSKMAWAQVDEEQDDYFSCDDTDASSKSEDDGHSA